MPTSDPFLWSVRLSWLILPLLAGPALADALHPRSVPVRTTASLLLWAGWAVVVVATLVPRPAGLTTYRVVAPAGFAAAVAAAATGEASTAWAAVALVVTAVAAVAALLADTGRRFVDGGAYGDERRHLLRPPGPVLLGPLPVAWALLVAGVVTGPLMLASELWLTGAALTAVGLPLAVVLVRALHALTLRWVVFVPAGLVLKDHLALVDPVLFRRDVIEVLRPAPADTDSIDLTARSPGLALELRLREKVPMLRATPGKRQHTPGQASRLLFTPTRPGAVLADARRRRIPVG